MEPDNVANSSSYPVISRKNRKRKIAAVVTSDGSSQPTDCDAPPPTEEAQDNHGGEDITIVTRVISRKNRIKRRKTTVTEATVVAQEQQQEESRPLDQDKPTSAAIKTTEATVVVDATQAQQQQQEQEQRTKEPLLLSQVLQQFELARRSVSRSHTITQLSQRDKEEQFLRQMIENCVEEHVGAGIILAGQPGTGKTASVDILLDSYGGAGGNRTMKILKLNCMGHAKGDFVRIIGNFLLSDSVSGSSNSDLVVAEDLSGSGSINEKRAYITNQYMKRVAAASNIEGGIGAKTGFNKLKLIVLDEIESVPDKMLLQDMLKWTKNRPLVIIGITNDANNVSIWKQDFEHQLSFSPYSKAQMKNILSDRLKGYEQLLSKPALEFISAKTFDSGSARTCLDIAEAAMGSVIHEITHIIRTKGDMEITEQDNTYKVQLKHVQPHIKSSLTISSKIETIVGLPSAQKMLLCSCFKLLKLEKKEFTIDALSSFYSKFKQHPELKDMVTRLTSQQIIDFCKRLQDNGLISIALPRGSKVVSPKCKVSLDLSENDMVTALGKFTWYTKIMEMK